MHCIAYLQHEAKMKSLSETVKDGEQRKRHLQEQIDQLNEECAKLAAQGPLISSVEIRIKLQPLFTNLLSFFAIAAAFLAKHQQKIS